MLLGGCSQQQKTPAEPPLAAPPVATSVDHFLGTPLSGPTTQPAPVWAIASADALSVQVTFVALGQMPAGGEPLGARAKLIAATRGGAPVLAAPRLTSGTRVAPMAEIQSQPQALAAAFGKGTGPTAPVGSATGALPVGVTARFQAAEALATTDPATGRPWRRMVQIDVYRPPEPGAIAGALAAAPGQPAANAGGQPQQQPLQVALVVEDLVRPESPADRDKLFAAEQSDKPTKSTKIDKPANTSQAPKPVEPPPAPPAEPPAPQRELALADLPVPPAGGSVAIAVPFQFAGSKAKAVAAVITIAPGADNPAHREAVSRCATDLHAAAVAAAAEQRASPAGGGQWAGLEVALAALERPEHRRSGMIYLAGQTGATLCSDAVLVADEPNLAGLAAAVRKAVPPAATAPQMRPAAGDPTLAAANTPGAGATAASTARGAAADPASLGWTLDLTTLQFLGEALNAAKLPPELASVLMLHAGEAGRHAASIEQLTRGVSGRADFDGRVLGENLIFLEDSSPSSRVRAYDWLGAHGHAPAGYDPLGPPKARRAALEQMLAGATTAPAAAPASHPAELSPAAASIDAHADPR